MKEYSKKIHKYSLVFSLKDSDLVAFLESETKFKNMSVNSYFKMLLKKEMNTHK